MYAVCYPFGYRRHIRQTVARYVRDLDPSGTLGRVSLLLTDDTLTERTETVTSVVRWEDMKGVEVVGECVYIRVTGLQVAIIPRRGFERAEDYEAVRDFALTKLHRSA